MAVAGPRAESVARTPENTAVARREAPARLEREARLTERVSRLIGAPHPRHSCRGRTPRSPCGPRERGSPAHPGPLKQHGRSRMRGAKRASPPRAGLFEM